MNKRKIVDWYLSDATYSFVGVFKKAFPNTKYTRGVYLVGKQ